MDTDRIRAYGASCLYSRLRTQRSSISPPSSAAPTWRGRRHPDAPRRPACDACCGVRQSAEPILAGFLETARRRSWSSDLCPRLYTHRLALQIEVATERGASCGHRSWQPRSHSCAQPMCFLDEVIQQLDLPQILVDEVRRERRDGTDEVVLDGNSERKVPREATISRSWEY